MYQISEIVLLTKKLYCLPKIFVKNSVASTNPFPYALPSNTSLHGCRRVRVLTSLGAREREREGKWPAWLQSTRGVFLSLVRVSIRTPFVEASKAPPSDAFSLTRFRARVLVADCPALPDRQLSQG
jgi:hypothetical protein